MPHVNVMPDTEDKQKEKKSNLMMAKSFGAI